MNLIEKATIVHYHRRRISEHGSGSVQALGWRCDASQGRRFEVIASVGDLSGCSLLDVGCGSGDLKDYLDRRYSRFTYLGIDQMPEFIAAAKTRHADAVDTFFYQTDFTTATLPRVDYVIASGALGYRCEDPDFVPQVIGRLYAAADKALAFNMLDAARFPEHPLLVGHDPERIVAVCRTLAPAVEMVRGYLADDFTVFMFRDRHGSDGRSA